MNACEVNANDLPEVWIAGGPIWINFANTTALACKGLTDVVSSQDSLRWWFRIMGLHEPSNLGLEELAFAAELRETLTRVIDRLQKGTIIDEPDMSLFNAILRKQSEWHELDQLDQGVIVRKLHRSVETIEQAFGPIVESLSDTLVYGDLTRLRTCAHPDCSLSFYDESKNGARRWCTMAGCGNRAKAMAYLQRKKLRA